MLSKDQLLQKRELRRVTVDVPEFGGSVTIQELTVSQRSKFEASLLTNGKADTKKQAMIREKLIVMSVIDEDGELLLSESDIAALSDQPAAGIERIFNAITELNGISGKDVEELEKN